MAITFPAAPTNGQVYTDTTSGQSWTWDGVKWKGASSTAYWKRTGTAVEPYTAGDTIQGQLVPTNGALGFRNVLINGDLKINQRGATIAAAAAGAYGPDRWKKVDAGNMTQVVEDVNFVPGMKYTLSWKGGTPQVLTAPGSGHWTLPNIPITATEIQLEMGEVATPYERRSMALEDLMCKRYYLFRNGAVACSPKTSGLLATLPGLDEMRAMPTVTLVDSTCYFYNGTTWTNGKLTSITAKAFGTTRFLDATGLAGQVGTPLAASINITLSAEL